MQDLGDQIVNHIDSLVDRDEPNLQRDFIEVWQNRSVVDPLSGEIIDILDVSIPIENKADAFAWVLDKLAKEKEVIKERQQLWQERKKRLESIIDRLKDFMLDQMKKEAKTKAKTAENTLYIQERTEVVTNIDELHERDCVIELKILGDGYTIEHIKELIHDIQGIAVTTEKKKYNPAVLPRLIQEGKAYEKSKQTLCRR